MLDKFLKQISVSGIAFHTYGAGLSIMISFIASVVVTGVTAMTAKQAVDDFKAEKATNIVRNKAIAAAVLSGVATVILGFFVAKGFVSMPGVSI